MIKFGTDGWRAIVGEDFTEDNVEKVTLAIAKYIHEKFGFEQEILIGYDPRNMALEYAKYCADILAGKGFKVILSSRIVPTPILAYNALIKKASAIMFTASHNPAKYLGMKYIPEYAGPATSDITDAIMANLDNNAIPQAENYYDVIKTDFSSAYYEHLEKIIDFEKIKSLKTNIIYDGLYSASIGYFDEILRRNGVVFDTLRMEYDKHFGGMNPDPKPEQLKQLAERVKLSRPSIGVANDGDADRFGIIDEDGEYVSPNAIIALLLKYLHKKGMRGAVIKTVGSSILIDRVAASLGVEVIETSVGFKHVGEAMRQNKIIIGGEESGGLSIGGHIPEKDGLLANLLVLEAVADSRKTLSEMVKNLYEEYGYFYTSRNDYKKSDENEIKSILDMFRGLKILAGLDVTNIDTKDGVKLMFGENTKILARPSGTEPLLRVYFESNSKDMIKMLEAAVYKLL